MFVCKLRFVIRCDEIIILNSGPLKILSPFEEFFDLLSCSISIVVHHHREILQLNLEVSAAGSLVSFVIVEEFSETFVFFVDFAITAVFVDFGCSSALAFVATSSASVLRGFIELSLRSSEFSLSVSLSSNAVLVASTVCEFNVLRVLNVKLLSESILTLTLRVVFALCASNMLIKCLQFKFSADSQLFALSSKPFHLR
ncbi:hypothetical protein FF38_13321 [Lucilia cuprina]|uniref:Uncharacterized protein n=1 Tax=Lucilia cuprina TaxID=7375 RepID=A0A0L0BTM9_LUCCU|nr:hypothetical protein FF38_13321 [Lucilia cuprina]